MELKERVMTVNKLEFKKWQCLCRQAAMRDNKGRPDSSFAPVVYLNDEPEPFTQIITIMNKSKKYSETAEMLHIARKTKDPSEIRDNGLKYLSATYYQKADEFSNLLTATFPPDSQGAKTILDAKFCKLVFEAYSSKYTLACRVKKLGEKNPYRQGTLAHNRLFNPYIPADTIVLGFKPNWEESVVER